MPTLPSDADIQLPQTIMRREPVGSYDPSAVSQGARQLGQGLEQLGQGASVYALHEVQQQNALQEAKAESQAVVGRVNTLASLPTITDPTQLPQVKQQLQTNFDQAASMITDPNRQALFRARHAPQIAEAGVQIDNHGRTLVNGQNLADTLQSNITATNTALSTDDPKQQAEIIDAQSNRIAHLINFGQTAPQVQAIREAFANQYANAKGKSELTKAEQSGDTDRLQKFIDGLPGQQQPTDAVNASIPAEGRALLDTIAGPEAGRAGYNAKYPGGSFQGFGDHPRQASVIQNGPDAGKTSDAAGRYQFLSSTWDQEAKKKGLKDFSPANQDAAAWDLAQTTYKQQTGGDLLTALKSKDPSTISGVASALSGQWSSLPGGHQPGTTSNAFTSAFQANLAKTPSAAPLNITNPTGNAFVIGDSLGRGVKSALGADGVAADSRQPGDVLVDINGGTDSQGNKVQALTAEQLAGKTIVLSGGSSNNPKAGPDITGQQVNALIAKGVDPKDIRILGVGDRPDFATNAVNAKLQALARSKGATFVPISPSILGTDHVHPTNYASVASAVTGQPVGVPSSQGPPSVYQYLKPEEAQQLALRATNSIDQIQRRTIQAANQQTTMDMTDLKGWTSNLVSGAPVADQDWDQVRQSYANSPNPVVRQAFQNADAVRNKIASYRGQTPSEIAADVANQHPDVMDERGQGVRAASQTYLKAYQEQLSKDPLGRAAQDGVVGDLQPLDPTKPTFAHDVQVRMAQGDHVADFYHQGAQYLRPEERTALKTIATQGGQPMIDAAAGIVHGMGPKASEMFREIGADAPSFASIGRLQLQGGDPEAIKDIAKVQQIMGDKDAKGELPAMSVKTMRGAGLDTTYGTAFSGMPEQYRAEMQDAARKLWQAKALRENLDPSSPPADADVTRSAQLAAGATFDKDGNQYGGVEWNGSGMGASNRVPVPSNMKADEFRNAILTVTDKDLKSFEAPPTDAAGHPVSAAQIHNGYLTAVPDKDGVFRGAYMVSANDPISSANDPRWVMTPGGSRFVLDMGRLENIVRNRLPGAYRGGAVSAPVSTPPTFQRARGTLVENNP